MRKRIVEYLKPIPSTSLDAAVNRIVIEGALGYSAHRVRIAIEPPSQDD
jgi:hypothetical protein